MAQCIERAIGARPCNSSSHDKWFRIHYVLNRKDPLGWTSNLNSEGDPDGIAERMRVHAAALQHMATEIEALSKQAIHVPTLAEFQARLTAVQKALEADLRHPYREHFRQRGETDEPFLS
jgi:hypothetical protein